MKHTKSVAIPARTEERVYHVTCDMCGEEIKNNQFSAETVTISHKTGSSFPEFGCGGLTEIDMCGKCFDEKLVPWLKSQGVSVTQTEWGY